MDKLIKLAMSTLLIFSVVIVSTYSQAASAAGCQVLSKKTLERKAKHFKKTIRSASNKYGVSEDLIKAVITVESCFRRKARGTSGEKGLMQLMPATARRFSVRRGYNAWENVHGGTRYLSYLLKRYKGDTNRAIAAYNAGEGNVKFGRRIRNIAYVHKVMRAYRKLSHGKKQRIFNAKKAYKVSKRKTRGQRKTVYKTRKTATRATKKALSRNTFKAKPGHTVYEVMRQTGVPVDKLISLNGLQKPYHLEVGQRLRLR